MITFERERYKNVEDEMYWKVVVKLFCFDSV